MNEFIVVSCVILCLYLVFEMFTTKIIPQEVSIKNAITATLFWILSAGVFGILLLFISPKDGAQFLSVFTLEKLLSFDNLFVFSLIFTYFSVPKEYRYKVLHWGILGAIVLRFLFITLGVGVITFFKPAMILMGVWVLYTVYQMYQLDEESEIEENKVVKLFRKLFPVTDQYNEDKFFVSRVATPLFIVLLMVETSDIMFALDSVPAAFGVTQNIPIIFLANIFAICGLRNLYFVLEVVKDKFESVKHGIALILVLIGLKMVFGQFIHISEIATMAIILSILVGTVVISVITNKVKGEK